MQLPYSPHVSLPLRQLALALIARLAQDHSLTGLLDTKCHGEFETRHFADAQEALNLLTACDGVSQLIIRSPRFSLALYKNDACIVLDYFCFALGSDRLPPELADFIAGIDLS